MEDKVEQVHLADVVANTVASLANSAMILANNVPNSDRAVQLIIGKIEEALGHQEPVKQAPADEPCARPDPQQVADDAWKKSIEAALHGLDKSRPQIIEIREEDLPPAIKALLASLAMPKNG